MLSLTHVIAGTTAARTLAENGEEVLHIARDQSFEHELLVTEVNVGMRSAFVDLKNPAQNKTFATLIPDADVFIEGFRGRAMENLGIKRFVCESSLGIGDSKGQLGFLYNFVLIPILLRNIFADKEVQEKIIAASPLDWIIVRPGALTNGPRTGVYKSGFDPSDKSIQAKVSRADVADFMLKQATSDGYLRKAPGLSY